MESPKLFLSSNIKFLRNRMKKSQEDVAAGLEINRSKLKSYEDESAINPPLQLLNKMSGYFKFNIDMLINTDLSKITEFSLSQIERGYEDYIKGTNLRILATTVD